MLCSPKTRWVPTLVEVSCKFGFVFLSVCNARCPDQQLFLIFFHEVKYYKLRKVRFWKKTSDGLWGLKKSLKWIKMAEKVLKRTFLSFWGKKFHSYMHLFFSMIVPMTFQLFAKAKYLEEIWFLSYGRKTSRPIRMQDFLNYNISQISWGMKFIFWMSLEFHENNK